MTADRALPGADRTRGGTRANPPRRPARTRVPFAGSVRRIRRTTIALRACIGLPLTGRAWARGNEVTERGTRARERGTRQPECGTHRPERRTRQHERGTRALVRGTRRRARTGHAPWLPCRPATRQRLRCRWVTSAAGIPASGARRSPVRPGRRNARGARLPRSAPPWPQGWHRRAAGPCRRESTCRRYPR